MQRHVQRISAILNALASISPPFAGRLALRLLITPIAQPNATRGQAVLDSAQQHTLETTEGRLRVYTWGTAGQAVLLAHGWRAQSGSMSAFVEPLIARGYRVVAFDAPAHAHSSGRTCTIDQYAAAMQQVRAHYAPIIAIIAHSFGVAVTAQALAQNARDVQRVALIAAPQRFEYAMQRFTDSFGLKPHVHAAMRAAFERRSGYPLARYTIENATPHIHAPALIVHDRQDAEVPLYEGQAVAQAWPNASLVVTDGLGHNNLLRDASVVAQVVAYISADNP